MICKHCGREIEDTATFCCYCGKRVNGKITCAVCGAQMPDDALYCSDCGALLEENKPVRQSGYTEVAAVDAVDAAVVPESGEAVAASASWKKIIEYICCGLVACAALFGFVFTFLIGFKSEYLGIGTSQRIYYYFGDVYINLKEFTSSSNATVSLASVYFVAVVGTVIAAVAIICGVVFGSMTVAAAVKKFGYKRANVNFYKPAILTYLSFAVCATAFLAHNAVSMTYGGSIGSSTAVSSTASVVFDDATVAGLVVGGIPLGLYCVCRVVVRLIDAVKYRKSFADSVIAVILGVFAVAVVAVSAMPALSISGGNNAASFGYPSFLSMLVSTYSDTSLLQRCVACGIVGFAVQMVILILAAKALFSAIWFIETGKTEKTLGLAITNIVFSCVNIAMSVISSNAFTNANSTTSVVLTSSYSVPIALAVLSVLLMVVAIVFKIYNHKAAIKALQ